MWKLYLRVIISKIRKHIDKSSQTFAKEALVPLALRSKTGSEKDVLLGRIQASPSLTAIPRIVGEFNFLRIDTRNNNRSVCVSVRPICKVSSSEILCHSFFLFANCSFSRLNNVFYLKLFWQITKSVNRCERARAHI